jgi:hypothetical protein
MIRPSFSTILLTFGLLVISSWLWRMYVISTVSDTFPHGFPFQFYLGWGPCPSGKTCYEFNGLNLVFDLAFWYLVSAFLVTKFQRK